MAGFDLIEMVRAAATGDPGAGLFTQYGINCPQAVTDHERVAGVARPKVVAVG